ncbi:TetR/AcrR family transcriptional regulator C-terminal domain-containing protein [Myceligenerans pegani]|uniref:TetR/AcrR family transcriptional regulator C-terminal domain-containing protein n=1 Tax=Myceligenerans pegani TaxID=2776917 RepID=UPI00299F35D2|nr:TetR/AcrR family transcriptional regulator C-terminal domain-containing protein [Myceligenerans sp. TRM 65318]
MTETQHRRRPLNRGRVQAAAVQVADRDGLKGITMRSVADLLGVEAMALYRHVSGKNDLLDSLVEVVIGEINTACDALPAPEDPADWRTNLRRRILTARSTLLVHRWAPALISTHGTMGPELMRYFDEFGATLAAGGFSLDTIHHALHAFGPRALGFAPELFELEAPAVTETDLDEQAALADMAALAEEMPFLARMAQHLSHEASTTLGWCDDQAEFEFGLDVMLDGLEKRLNS